MVEAGAPPTDEELERWMGWESRTSAALAGVLGSPALEDELAERDVLEQEARRSGLTLSRALVLRERIFSVLGERARLAVLKALVATLEEAERGRTSEERGRAQLRDRLRQARTDLRASTRASASRALYGDRWVEAILRSEAGLARAYSAALAQAGGRSPRLPNMPLGEGGKEPGP